MRRIFNLLLVASVAASFMFAGSAFAQDKLDELYGKHGGAKPKISGNAGYAFGQWTIAGHDNDAAAEDITGLVTMLEANIVFTGGNGPLDYRWRMRMRGRDRPEAFGDAGIFAGGGLNTLRGHVRWSPTKNLKIRIAKPAVSSTTSMTEVDPIQNLPCACFIADLFDRGILDFQFAMGVHTIGFTVAGETPGSMSTTGVPVGNPGSGGRTAGTENQSLTGFVKLKFGGFKVNGSVVTASGTNHDGTLKGESFDATGLRVHIAFPIGTGVAKFDVETATSDLDPTNDLDLAGPVAGVCTIVGIAPCFADEEVITYTGAAIQVGGMNIGFGTGTATTNNISGPDILEVKQTNISAHWRFPMGKGGWVGPEVQLQTRTLTVGGVAGEDEEITSLRWLHRIGF